MRTSTTETTTASEKAKDCAFLALCLAVAALLGFLAAGCATIHGAAQDTKALASYVERHSGDQAVQADK
jgi:predicted small secreted protein